MRQSTEFLASLGVALVGVATWSLFTAYLAGHLLMPVLA